jgi:protein-tyrosine-phosphatase
MAAALFQNLLEQEGLLPGWRVESAGTWREEGFPATADARRAMQERGIDLSHHRSRTVTAVLLKSADLVLVMESAHARNLRDLFPPLAERVHLLTEMVGESHDIEDPVGMGLERYRSLADYLQALFVRALPRIRQIVSP